MKKVGEKYQYLVSMSMKDDAELGWVYAIYMQEPYTEAVTHSKDWFDTVVEAEFAATGHISLLEKETQHD